MIDLHCHIDLYDDPSKVISKCCSEKMYLLSVTTTPKAWFGTSALASKKDRIRTSLGFHPQLVHERYSELELFDMLLCKTRYVGEIGMDGGIEFKKHVSIQKQVFEHILQKSKLAGGKYLSIHSRLAASEVLSSLAKYPDAGIPILHWYSGSSDELHLAIKLGCWFSVGPAMLASKKGKAIVNAMPRERIITETDGPFGIFRGRKLMPWDIKIALDQLSQLWNCSFQEADKIINDNFKMLLKELK